MVASLGELPGESEDLTLRGLFALLWRGRWLVIASGFVFAVIFGGVGFLMTPMYRAIATLTSTDVERSEARSALGSAGTLATMIGLGANAERSSQIEEALAVLRSREFTERFISDRELLPKLFARDWDARGRRWKVSGDEQPTLARGFRYFNEIRTARKDLLTGLVQVQIEWRDPAEAAAWANELVARLNGVMRDRAIASADASISFLEKELERANDLETRGALGRLLESQLKQRMVADVSGQYAFRVVDAALPPDLPFRPRKTLMVLLGGITGVFIGTVAVFTRAASIPRVK